MISPFSQEIEAARNAETVSDAASTLEHTSGARLEVRNQGCFVTELKLTDPGSGEQVEILYSDPDHTKSKLSASHIMSPVGPSEGLGGQHGFPRWANYHAFPLTGASGDEKQIAFQAKRSDMGIGISKEFSLGGNTLYMETTLQNPEPGPVQTSLGEHLYFALPNENTEGLRLDGKTLDELLGDGSEATIMSGEAMFWPDFSGAVKIDFPAGHSIEMSTYALAGEEQVPLGMLIWHRPGTPSICFEPTVGFDPNRGNEQLEIAPSGQATLSTSIELLEK